MRAAVYHRIGAARDVMRIEDVDLPEPGPREVRVRIHVSGINPTDWKSRAGVTPPSSARPHPSKCPSPAEASSRRLSSTAWAAQLASTRPWS